MHKQVIVLVALFAVCAHALVDIRVPADLQTGSLTQLDTYYFGELAMSGSPAGGSGLANQGSTGTTQNFIKPCEWHYWLLPAQDFEPSDWLNINATARDAQLNTDDEVVTRGNMALKVYIGWTSDRTDWSQLPNENKHMWKITVNDQRSITDGAGDDFFMEVRPCDLKSTGFYWVAVQGLEQETTLSSWLSTPYTVRYWFEVRWRRALGSCTEGTCSTDAITELTLGEEFAVFNDTRPVVGEFGDEGNQASQDRVRDWRYFSVQVPMDTQYAEGSFLVVNVSHVLSDVINTSPNYEDVSLATNFGAVPFYDEGNGDGWLSQQTNADGQRPNEVPCSSGDICYNLANSGVVFPDGRVKDCRCTPGSAESNVCELLDSGLEDRPDYPPRQRTCSLLVNPCSFRYDVAEDGTRGTNYYIGVRMPRSVLDANDDVYFHFTNYTVLAYVRAPEVTEIAALPAVVPGSANLPNVDDELIMFTRWTHYKFELPTSAVSANTNLQVRLTNVQGGRAQVHVRRGTDSPGTDLPDFQLAGPGHVTAQSGQTDPCACRGNVEWSCSGCDHCSFVVHKCWLTAGTWYVAVEPLGTASSSTESPSSRGVIPIDYHLEVSLYDDPLPAPIAAGVPQHGVLFERHYDFYVLDVPRTKDVWLYVELFADAADTDLTLQMLYGEQPGETCFPEGDFVCHTGSQARDDTAVGESSCYFMVDACHLFEGPLYLSVYGLPNQVNTRRVHYTLWAEFETAWQIQNNVTYTDTVRVDHYNHYYLRVDEVIEGSYLTVEVDNIQYQTSVAGGDRYLNAFLNYESLAGQCPCYQSLVNCTGDIPDSDLDCDGSEFCDNQYGYLDSNYNIPLAKYTPIDSTSGYLQDSAHDVGCCKLYVDACSFRAGTYYIAVQGLADDQDSFDPVADDGTYASTALGYTMTAIVHPAPPVFELPMGVPLVDWVADEQLNHYRLAGSPIDGSNLVLRVTFMQDQCGRFIEDNTAPQSGHEQSPEFPGAFFLGDGQSGSTHAWDSDNTDFIELRVNGGNLAHRECYTRPWSCRASRDSFSSCTLVIPSCEWAELAQPLFVSTFLSLNDARDPRGSKVAQFTLEASVEQEPLQWLTPSLPMYGSLHQARYNHYAIHYDDIVPQRMDVSIYYNSDRSTYGVQGNTAEQREFAPLFSMNYGGLAGRARQKCNECVNATVVECTDRFACHWQFDPCDLDRWGAGDYYFSVFNYYKDFYDLPLEYTLKVEFADPVVTLSEGAGARFSDYVWPTMSFGNQLTTVEDDDSSDNEFLFNQRHYKFALESVSETNFLTLRVANVLQGDVAVYINKDGLAGRCPCYDHAYFLKCGTNAECDGAACEITIPPCELTPGTFYLNVVGNHFLGSSTAQIKPINYQIEVLLGDSQLLGPLTPTNTEQGGNAFNLGWSGAAGPSAGDKWLWPISEDDVDDFIDWDSNNRFDDVTADNGEYVHFTFTVSDPNAQVHFLLDNVRGKRCHWDNTDVNPTTVSLYFNGQSGVDMHEFGDTPSASARLQKARECGAPCSRHITTLCDDQADGSQCYGIVPPCLVQEAGTYYLSARIDADTNFGTGGSEWRQSHFNYASGWNPVTFDLKVFLQQPIELVRDEYRNVSHVFHAPQRFVLNGVEARGTAPMSRVLFRNLQLRDFERLAVAMWPGKQAGWKQCANDNDVNSVRGPCLDSACLEVRGGLPLTNQQVFEDDEDVSSNLLTFNFQCASDCHVNLMPCALKAGGIDTVWHMTVNLIDTATQASDGEAMTSRGSPVNSWPYYEVTYENLADRATSNIIEIPQAFIDNRERYPGPEDHPTDAESQVAIRGYESMKFFHFSISGIDKDQSVGSGNNTVDNSNHRRLEVQVEALDIDDEDNGDCCDGVTNAPVVFYIARGEPDSSSDDSVIQTLGLPPVRPISNAALLNGQPQSNSAECGACSMSTYMCGTTTAGTLATCATADNRFYVPSCCLTDGTYWVVARLLAPGKRGVRVRVRTVEQKGANPGADSALVQRIDADDLVSQTTTPANNEPLRIVRLTDTSSGLEPQNYHHFVTELRDSHFADTSATPTLTRSLIFNLTVDDDTDDGSARGSGDIYLFVQRGVRAGSPNGVLKSTGSTTGYGYTLAETEDCMSWTYACSLGDTQLDRCLIEIPYSQLSAGDWYFSVYSDRYFGSFATGLWNYRDTDEQFDNYVGYELEVYLRPEARATDSERVAEVPSTNSLVCWNRTESGDAPLKPVPFAASGTPQTGHAFVHHIFHVSQAVLEEGTGCGTGPNGCLYEKWLNIYVRNLQSDDADDEAAFFVYMQTPQTVIIDGVAQNLEGPAGFGYQDYAASASRGGRYPINQRGSYGLDSNWLLSYTAGGVPVYETSVSPQQTDPNVDDHANWPKRIYPCPADRRAPALVAGNYYISIETPVRARYDMCAGLVHPDYTRVTTRTAVESSAAQGETATEEIGTFSWDFDTSGTDDNEDDHDRYIMFEVPAAEVSSSMRYLQFNWTNLYCDPDRGTCDKAAIETALSSGELSLEVWRDDCQRWNCGTPTEPQRTLNDLTLAAQPSYGGCSAVEQIGVDQGVDDDDAVNPGESGFTDWHEAFRVVIDATGLAPCSLDAGRYYLRIRNDAEIDYELKVWLRTGLQAALTDMVPVVSTIHQYQYHFYSIDVQNARNAALYATLTDVTCGQVEMFAKRGTPAGPRALRTDVRHSMINGFVVNTDDEPSNTNADRPVDSQFGCEKCSSAYCRTSELGFGEADVDVGTCSIFVDTCELLPATAADDSASVTWFFTVRGVEQQAKVHNVLVQPVSYTLTAGVKRVQLNEDQSIGCAHELIYDTDTDYVCGGEAGAGGNLPPQHFVYDVETLSDIAQLRFTLERDGNTDAARAVVNMNAPVSYSYATSDRTQVASGTDDYLQQPCDGSAATLSITGTSDSSSVTFGGVRSTAGCAFYGPKRFYTWVSGTQGRVQLTLERWEPYTPVILPGILYDGSINIAKSQDSSSGTVGRDAINAPYRPQWQHYRLPNMDTSSATWSLNVNVHYVRNGVINIHVVLPDRYAQGKFYCLDTTTSSTQYSSTESYPQTHTIPKCELSSDRAPTYLSVEGTTRSCNSVCKAIEYGISYNLGIAVEEKPCNVPFCDRVYPTENLQSPGFEQQTANYYRLSESSAVVEPVLNGDFQYPYTTLRVRDFGAVRDSDFDADDDDFQWGWSYTGDLPCLDTYESDAECAAPVTGQNTFRGLDEPAELWCPYSTLYFGVRAVETDSRADSVPYKVEPFCHSVTVTDVTAAVFSATGFTASEECTGAKTYYYSWMVDETVDTVTQWLDVSSSGATFVLYRNNICPTSVACSSTTSCDEICGFANVRYYAVVTVTGNADYTFNAVVRGPSSGFPSQQVAVNEASDGITVGTATSGNGVLVYFDVSANDLNSRADNYIVVELRDVSHGTVNAQWAKDTVPATGCTCDQVTYSAGIRKTSYADLSTDNQLVIDHCQVSEGRYYVRVWTSTSTCDAHPVTFRIKPSIREYGIAAPALGFDQLTSGSLLTRNYRAEYNFYTISVEAGDRSSGQVRLANVRGGQAELLVSAGHLPGYDGVTANSAQFINENAPFNEFATSLAVPTYDSIESFGPYHQFGVDQSPSVATCPCGIDYRCQTGYSSAPSASSSSDILLSPLNNQCGSCAIAIDPCSYATGTYYAAVRVLVQDAPNVAVQYDIEAHHFDDFTELVRNEESALVSFSSQDATFRQNVPAGNAEYNYYSLSTDGAVTSIVLEVHVNGQNGPGTGSQPGDEVEVRFYDNICQSSSNVLRTMTCKAEYESWVCEFEISVRADHPGSTEWFVQVYGKQGSYSLRYTLGTDNSVDPASALSFCADYVDYPVWRWNNLKQLDDEAACFYEQLQWRFDNPNEVGDSCQNNLMCQNGTSWACKQSLKAFACHNSFQAVDSDGFSVGVCHNSCTDVEEKCNIAFSSVALEHFSCTSSRYIERGTCSGHREITIDVPDDASTLFTSLSLIIASLIVVFFF